MKKLNANRNTFLVTAALNAALLLSLANFKTANNNDRKIASVNEQVNCAYDEAITQLEGDLSRVGAANQQVNMLMAEHHARMSGAQVGAFTESAYDKYKRQNPGMTQQGIQNYHQMVMDQRSAFDQRTKMGWTPAFQTNGDLANPIYGFGPNTFQGITQMYQNPMQANPSFQMGYDNRRMTNGFAQMMPY